MFLHVTMALFQYVSMEVKMCFLTRCGCDFDGHFLTLHKFDDCNTLVGYGTWIPCWRGDYTPQSSSDKMIRSLGILNIYNHFVWSLGTQLLQYYCFFRDRKLCSCFEQIASPPPKKHLDLWWFMYIRWFLTLYHYTSSKSSSKHHLG